jgi:hypothetical protein
MDVRAQKTRREEVSALPRQFACYSLSVDSAGRDQRVERWKGWPESRRSSTEMIRSVLQHGVVLVALDSKPSMLQKYDKKVEEAFERRARRLSGSG